MSKVKITREHLLQLDKDGKDAMKKIIIYLENIMKTADLDVETYEGRMAFVASRSTLIVIEKMIRTTAAKKAAIYAEKWATAKGDKISEH